jgi:hypothetical protein
MPSIEISQEQHDRLMAFKPVVEQVVGDQMSDLEFADFIVFCAVERLFLEASMSGDRQVIDAMRSGDSPLAAALNTLQSAQLTLQAVSRQFPGEIFGLVAGVWQGMSEDDRRDKGMGFHVLWEEQATELSVDESGAAFIVLSGARVEVADS